MQMRIINTELALPQQGKYTPIGTIETEPQIKDGKIAQDDKEDWTTLHQPQVNKTDRVTPTLH